MTHWRKGGRGGVCPSRHRGKRRHTPRRRSCVGGTRMPWCAAAVEGMRTWSTPSVLLRLLEQASLILREGLSGQALVPSGGTLFRLCQHVVGGLQSPHA